MEDVVIRKATLKEIPMIEEIFKETSLEEYRTQYPNTTKQSHLKRISESKKRLSGFRKGTKGKEDLLLIATKNNKIVGFGQAWITEDKFGGWIDKLYILKEYRRQGIGDKLTNELIKWLKNKRVKELLANTLIKNIASLNNFEKRGFERWIYTLRKELK